MKINVTTLSKLFRTKRNQKIDSRFFMSLLAFLLFIAACSRSQQPPSSGESTYQTVKAFPNLSFTRPVDLEDPGDGSNRLFVVEQRGVISVFQNDPTVSNKSVFLDIQNRVDDRGNEEGLLGLAFSPDFEDDGYFYVNYTTPDSKTHISRFHISSQNPQQADPQSEEVLLSYDQPYNNHNGGKVAFGPDGYLYIGVGDGGSGGDPHGNGQNRSVLLGKILRIDVNNRENGNNYAIPPDNPFASNNQGYRQEIYAYGMRNPWRFSFDSETGRLWVGDVGQNTYEEVDIVENGGNYGWNTMEGKHCFNPRNGCDRSGIQLPIVEYSHNVGVSVTGGYVYRGPTLNDLTGKYIYADYGSGDIWALDYTDMNNPVNRELLNVNFGISSFGVDQNNELYICGFDGSIYKLQPAS